jgi:predicted enzyme related to lactoylglutathione lyase
MAKNTFGHVEWACKDLEKAKTFFGTLFGWSFRPYGEDYYIIKTLEGIRGGLMKVDKVEPGNATVVYVEVEDIDKCLEKVKELGGAVLVPKTVLPDMGWYAQFTDLDGRTIGLFEAE